MLVWEGVCTQRETRESAQCKLSRRPVCPPWKFQDHWDPGQQPACMILLPEPSCDYLREEMSCVSGVPNTESEEKCCYLDSCRLNLLSCGFCYCMLVLASWMTPAAENPRTTLRRQPVSGKMLEIFQTQRPSQTRFRVFGLQNLKSLGFGGSQLQSGSV